VARDETAGCFKQLEAADPAERCRMLEQRKREQETAIRKRLRLPPVDEPPQVTRDGEAEQWLDRVRGPEPVDLDELRPQGDNLSGG
jgi:hypothetical protein